MEKLFNDSLLVKKERPTAITEQQKEKMYVDFAKEIIQNGHSSDEIETIVDDLKEICLLDDGFDIAKDLEENGNASYEFKGDFISFLDSMRWFEHDILQENVKTWVKAHNPQPVFKKGDCLIVESILNSRFVPDKIIHINDIQLDKAQYIVDFDKNRQGGTLINFEKLELNCVLFAYNQG